MTTRWCSWAIQPWRLGHRKIYSPVMGIIMDKSWIIHFYWCRTYQHIPTIYHPSTDWQSNIAIENCHWVRRFTDITKNGDSFFWLVVYLPLWKIWKSDWIVIPTEWKNKKCSKPPTSLYTTTIHEHVSQWAGLYRMPSDRLWKITNVSNHQPLVCMFTRG